MCSFSGPIVACCRSLISGFASVSPLFLKRGEARFSAVMGQFAREPSRVDGFGVFLVQLAAQHELVWFTSGSFAHSSANRTQTDFYVFCFWVLGKGQANVLMWTKCPGFHGNIPVHVYSGRRLMRRNKQTSWRSCVCVCVCVCAGSSVSPLHECVCVCVCVCVCQEAKGPMCVCVIWCSELRSLRLIRAQGNLESILDYEPPFRASVQVWE